MERTILNEYGEPIGVERVKSLYELEEDWCDEMQRRAEDDMYARQCENEYWYNQAISAFKERDIVVPMSVIKTLQAEMRRKSIEQEKQNAIDLLQPVKDWLESIGVKCVICYDYPTPQEVGYAYFETDITWEELEKLAKRDGFPIYKYV
jgi:hypothetical protein